MRKPKIETIVNKLSRIFSETRSKKLGGEICAALRAYEVAKERGARASRLPTGGLRMTGRHWDNLQVRMDASCEIWAAEGVLRKIFDKIKLRRQ